MPLRPASIPAVLIALCLGPAGNLSAQSAAGDEAAARAVADSALAAITRSDFIALTDLMLDSAVTFSAGLRNGEYRIQFRNRAQQRATSSGGRYVERGFNPEVRVSGPLAMLWLPYDFYRDGEWSHCGVDLFTLIKSDGGWRIATVAWSVEQPPDCARHPAGPPPEATAE